MAFNENHLPAKRLVRVRPAGQRRDRQPLLSLTNRIGQLLQFLLTSSTDVWELGRAVVSRLGPGVAQTQMTAHVLRGFFAHYPADRKSITKSTLRSHFHSGPVPNTIKSSSSRLKGGGPPVAFPPRGD